MLSKFSVKKPYTVVVGLILVLVMGIVSYMQMTIDLIPSMNLPYAVVATTYIGASPEQVETTVTSTLEQTLASTSNIDSISSISAENMSIIILAFNDDTNMDSAILEMRENLDMVTSFFPDEIGSPMIIKLNPDMMPIEILTVSVEGMNEYESANYIENRVIPEIKSVSGVASVTTTGLIENFIDVIISDDKINNINSEIEEYAAKEAEKLLGAGVDLSALLQSADYALPNISDNITTEMISGILSAQNFSMPAGSMDNSKGETHLIRVGDKYQSIDDLKSQVLFEIEGFGEILLDDVADVISYDNTSNMYSKVNGNHAAMISIQKSPDYSTAEVTNAVDDKMDEITDGNNNVKFTVIMNQGEYVNLMINSIARNLLLGAVFAIIVLYIFLRRFRTTFIVAASILFSVVFAVVLMYFSGITLNMISMGGLALGIGMLVDNSIVVIENIFRLRSRGLGKKEAAIEGAKQVSGAITASTLTTIVVFLPIVFTSGITRQLFADMALTIAYSLVASLIIALTLVPAASSVMLSEKMEFKRNFSDTWAEKYGKFLDKALDFKWLIIIVVVALFAASIFAGFSSGMQLFPAMDTGSISVSVTMPDSFTREDRYLALDDLNETLLSVNEIDTIGIMDSSDSTDAESSMMSLMGSGTTVYLTLADERDMTTDEIVDEIRSKTEGKEYEVTVSSSANNMTMLTGSGVSVNIYGNDLDNLRESAALVADEIRKVDGATEIDDGLERSSEEIRVIVNKNDAMKKGLTTAQVYMAVYEKTKAQTTSLNIENDDVSFGVYIKDNRIKTFTSEDIGDIILTAADGSEVKINEVAEIINAEGYTSIRRSNQERMVTVSGSLVEGYDVGDVNSVIEERLNSLTLPGNCRYEISGEIEMINDAFEDLFLMLILAVIFIYLVMVAQFQSFKSPFIVMFTIPLAFTGGFFAIFFTGTKLSIISIIGLIMLVGIVVNNGIVFVDYANSQRAEGKTVREALVITAKDRLRPIIMTALTTIIALMGMLFDTSMGSEMLKPIAIVTTGGLLYSTVLTLLFVPAIYSVFNKDKKVVEND